MTPAPSHDDTYITGIAQTHPIVPIALARNNLETAANLPDFIKHEIESTPNRQVFVFFFCIKRHKYFLNF